MSDLENTPTEDNLESAMDKVAGSLDPTRSRLIGKKKKDKDGTELSSTAQEQVLFRATTEDKQKWEECAKHLGVSMAEFLRVSANEKVERSTAVCEHPTEFRKVFPWREDCLKCGRTLWQKNDNVNQVNRR